MYCTPPSTPARILLALAALALGFSCAGNPERKSVPTASGQPASITLRDYRSGIVLRLINDSVLVERHMAGDNASLRRVAYYSQLDRQATDKVTDDALVAGILEAFDDRGFFRLAKAGQAPERVQEASTSLEVSRDGRSQHMLFSMRMPRSSQEAYRDCRKVFSEVYNRIDQYYSTSSVPTQVPKIRKRLPN